MLGVDDTIRTTKLVDDMFDTLIASNLRQHEAYVELLQATAKKLSAYINDSKDDIGASEIVELLAAVAPVAPGDHSDRFTKVRVGAHALIG